MRGAIRAGMRRNMARASARAYPGGFWLIAANLLAALILLAAGTSLSGQELPPPPPPAWPLTIVLPPRVATGEAATLAVIDANGRLAPGVQVQIGQTQGTQTNSTGRAYFRVPQASGALIVRGPGASGVALVSGDAPSAPAGGLSIAPIISLHDRFSICGGHFSGDADGNEVWVGTQQALVLAASPDCVVALAPQHTPPGAATISIQSGGQRWRASTTFVAFEFHEPPRLQPGQKGELVVNVLGWAKPLRLRVENGSPDVLRFVRGDSRVARTDGKPGNLAQIAVQAIRSGDFSFHAELVPQPDPQAARQFLQAAEPLAPPPLRAQIRSAADQIEHHPHDTEKAARELQKLSGGLGEGDLRTLIDAARAAL